MAELGHNEKRMIVELLAQFRSPTEIATHFKNECGLHVSIQQVVKYDPTRSCYEAGEIWRPIFQAAREGYLQDASKVPLANQAYRLNVLQEGVEFAKRTRNWKLVAQLLEQAAKEVGGFLTNSRDLKISDGCRARDMTPEDRATMLGSLIAEAIAERSGKSTKH